MKKHILILLLLVGFIFRGNLSLAQNTGFYGKRFFLQLGGTGHHNTIRNLAFYEERQLKDATYQYMSKENVKQYQVSGGVYGLVGYQLKKRFAISLDFQYYFSNKLIRDIDTTQNSNYGNFEGQFKYTALRIMPRIEIASSGALAPIGLVHVFGIGAEILNTNGKEVYLFNNNDYTKAPIKTNFNHIDKHISLVLLYGLEYRHPFTKNMGISLGGYAHLNASISHVGEFFFGTSSSNDFISGRIQESRIANVFSMRIGMHFTL